MDKISPCLWFDGKAEEAARFYTSLFPNSRIQSIDRSPGETPSGPKDMVLTVNFEIGGRSFIGLNGGPDFTFNEAISLSIDCEDQAEVDRYWARCSPTAARRASAAGSRTGTGSRGRSCHASCRGCSAAPTVRPRLGPSRPC